MAHHTHTASVSAALPAGYELRTPHHAFRIVRAIASGGFGITYQARNLVAFQAPGTTRVVPEGALLALKECFRTDVMERTATGEARPVAGEAAAVASLREQFLNEAFTLMRLREACPAEQRANAEQMGFVPIFHAGRIPAGGGETAVHYFVMPYLTGGSLRGHAGRMTPEQVVRTAYRLLRALRVLHRDAHAGEPVLHRDIKPENIMLTETGMPVLIDFGISSGTDNVGGTPDYSPHEQIRRTRMGRFTDLYSLGATLYELVAGTKCPRYDARPPYTESDPYRPLAADAAAVAAFREYGRAFEREFAAVAGRPYKPRRQDFAVSFLMGIDTALRTRETGSSTVPGRWQSATQWMENVFQGVEPACKGPTAAQRRARERAESETVWLADYGDSPAGEPAASRASSPPSEPGGGWTRKLLIAAIVVVSFILLALTLQYILHSYGITHI